MRPIRTESNNASDNDRGNMPQFTPVQSASRQLHSSRIVNNASLRTVNSANASENRRKVVDEREKISSSLSFKKNSQNHNQEQDESFGELFQKSARSFLGGNLARGESFSIMKAIGGVRGAIESILPAFIFILLFTITRSLLWTVVVSLGIAIIALIVRLAMREQLRSTIFGLIFVLICLASAWFSHNAKNFYLPGFIVDTIAIVFLLVLLVCQLPFIGIIVEVFHTPMSGGIKKWWKTWRYSKSLYWCYIWGTLVWVGLFACRLIVELPFYFTGNIAWLGTLRLALGVPLYVLAVWLTWAIVTPQVRKYDAQQEEKEDAKNIENNSRLIYNAKLAQIEGKDVVSHLKNPQDSFQVDIERPWSNKRNPDYKELNFSDSGDSSKSGNSYSFGNSKRLSNFIDSHNSDNRRDYQVADQAQISQPQSVRRQVVRKHISKEQMQKRDSQYSRSEASPLASRFPESSPSPVEFMPADSLLSEIYSTAFSFSDDIQSQSIPQFGGAGPKGSFYNQDLSQSIPVDHSKSSQADTPRSDTIMAFNKAINRPSTNSSTNNSNKLGNFFENDYLSSGEKKNKEESTHKHRTQNQQRFYDFNEGEPETFSSPFNIALPDNKDLDFK